MGNYVLVADIEDKGAVSDAQIEIYIDICEKFLEYYLNDLFYTKEDWIVPFDGTGDNAIFFGSMPNIISVDSVVSVDSEGVPTTIDTSLYKVEKFCLYRSPSNGIWALGRQNYRMVADIGHAATDLHGNPDDKYKSNTIKEAVKIMVANIINDYTDPITGTLISTDWEKYKQEKGSEYMYILKNPQSVSRKSEHPTGIAFVDMSIQHLKNRMPVLHTLDMDQTKVNYFWSNYPYGGYY